MTTMPPAADFVMPFGKWKGRPLSAVPTGYLKWCLREVQGMYPDTRAAIETYVGAPTTLPGTEAPPPAAKKKRAARRSSDAAAAPAATCGICGLAGTKDRPLVHASCATEDVPF